jgi:hypothetical protein
MSYKRSFYIAASWPRREEALKVSQLLVTNGFRSTARWIYNFASQGYEAGVDGMTPGLPEQDEYDVRIADMLICLTGDTLSKGGRHTELGIAIALRKPIFCVGPKEQVFHRHGLVTMVNDVVGLLQALNERMNPVNGV